MMFLPNLHQSTIQCSQCPQQNAKRGGMGRVLRRLALVVLLGCVTSLSAPPFAFRSSVANAQVLASVQIRYYMPQAGEVSLVWGINGWETVPVLLRPPGTVLKERILHTSMSLRDDVFVIDLQVPAGAMINYGFLVTKAYTGQAVQEWDRGLGAGYQALAVDGLIVEARTRVVLELVTQEIRYHAPKAGEVFLLWGINGWATIPEQQRPEGTELKNGVMNTPMARDGDSFVARIQIFSGTTIDYGFLTTSTADGEPVRIWDGQKAYRAIVSREGGIIQVDSDPTLTDDPLPAGTDSAPLVTEEISQQLPEAGEVFLVWGINGWRLLDEEQRPGGTVIKNNVMHTPMAREGDTFVVQVQVPSGATIDYGFLVTKTQDEEAVYIWNSDEVYHIVAREEESIVQDGNTEREGGAVQAEQPITPTIAIAEGEEAPTPAVAPPPSNASNTGLLVLLFGAIVLLVIAVVAAVAQRRRPWARR